MTVNLKGFRFYFFQSPDPSEEKIKSDWVIGNGGRALPFNTVAFIQSLAMNFNQIYSSTHKNNINLILRKLTFYKKISMKQTNFHGTPIDRPPTITHCRWSIASKLNRHRSNGYRSVIALASSDLFVDRTHIDSYSKASVGTWRAIVSRPSSGRRTSLYGGHPPPTTHP